MTSRLWPGPPEPTNYTLWDGMEPEEQEEALNFLQTLDPEAFDAASQLQAEEGSTSPARLAYLFSIMSDEDDR